MTNLRNDLEYIVHCEDDGTIIGPISKHHAHLPGVRATLCHYATRSMVRNLDLQKFGIQKVGKKKTHAWNGGFSGHNTWMVETGADSHEQTMIKEGYEELGLDITIVDTFDFSAPYDQGKIIRTSLHHNEKSYEYVGFGLVITHKTTMQFIDGETIDFGWFTSQEITDSIHAGESKFDSWLINELAIHTEYLIERQIIR